MSPEEAIERMCARVDARVAEIQRRAEKTKRVIRSGRVAGEEGRVWLERFAEGNGLDICCGDLVIGDAEGLDGDRTKIGADWNLQGDEVTSKGPGELDYIITNYVEAFPNPLKALNEWHRMLKPDGVLAMTCANAEKYENSMGPLANVHRQSVFTETTMRMYLERASFFPFEWYFRENEMRVAARKV